MFRMFLVDLTFAACSQLNAFWWPWCFYAEFYQFYYPLHSCPLLLSFLPIKRDLLLGSYRNIMSPYWYVDANSLCSQCASSPPPTYLACMYWFFLRYVWKCVLCKVLTNLTKFEYSRVSFNCVVHGGCGCGCCCSLDWHQQGTCTNANVLVVPAILNGEYNVFLSSAVWSEEHKETCVWCAECSHGHEHHF